MKRSTVSQEEGEEEGEEISNQPDFSIQKEDAEENSEVSTRTWDKEGEETIKHRAKKKRTVPPVTAFGGSNKKMTPN